MGHFPQPSHQVIRERWEELNHQTENLQVEVRALRERTQQLAVSAKQKSAEVERIKLRCKAIKRNFVVIFPENLMKTVTDTN